MNLPEIIERFNELNEQTPDHYNGMALGSAAKPSDAMMVVNDIIDEFRSDSSYDDLVLEMQYLKAALNPLVAEEERQKNL